MSTLTDQITLGVTAVVAGIFWGQNLRRKDSIEKCTAAYYAARKSSDYANHRAAAQNATFVACMKTEFPKKFSAQASKSVKIEEFKDVE